MIPPLTNSAFGTFISILVETGGNSKRTVDSHILGHRFRNQLGSRAKEFFSGQANPKQIQMTKTIIFLDDLEKSRQPDGFVKSSRCKAHNSSRVRRTWQYAATTKVKRNAADGLFTKPSKK
jgi:hypothetical protein